jgi:hypothetical protein
MSWNSLSVNVISVRFSVRLEYVFIMIIFGVDAIFVFSQFFSSLFLVLYSLFIISLFLVMFWFTVFYRFPHSLPFFICRLYKIWQSVCFFVFQHFISLFILNLCMYLIF